MPGHDIVIVLTGCFILAFGWFGFNPGSTLGASGALRISSVAVDTMLAGCTGSFGAVIYMWIKYGKPDASMTGQRSAGGTGGDYRSQRLRQLARRMHHRPHRRSAGLSQRRIRRPRSAHRRSGRRDLGPRRERPLGGYLGRTVRRRHQRVKGLFYGDAGQLVAQLIGMATLLGFVFPSPTSSTGSSTSSSDSGSAAADELEGLDIPEMGALCYPEFVLKPDTSYGGAAAGVKPGLQVARETA